MDAVALYTKKKGGNKGATPVGLSNRAAPEPVISLRKHGESHGCSLSYEGCLSTPGLGPNSQLAPLGETGRAARQPAQAVASPEPARVTVWATGMVQEAPQAAAPEPDRVTAGAAASTLRVANPLFGREEDSEAVYFQCEHGWSLISGEPDDTLQPVCPSEKCKDEGENWLTSEGLIAVVDGAQRVVNPLCTISARWQCRSPRGRW